MEEPKDRVLDVEKHVDAEEEASRETIKKVMDMDHLGNVRVHTLIRRMMRNQ